MRHLPQSQQFALKLPAATARGIGADMSNPKIDRETAERIRSEAKHWPQRVLIKRFGLSKAQIGRIVRGEAHA